MSYVRPTAFTKNDGTEVPFGSWHPVGEGFEVQALRTTYNIRHTSDMQVHRPAGPAGRDNLMMALFYGKIPNYVFHAYDRATTAGVKREDVY